MPTSYASPLSPEKANEMGRETAMHLLKGKHAFIVATHTD